MTKAAATVMDASVLTFPYARKKKKVKLLNMCEKIGKSSKFPHIDLSCSFWKSHNKAFLCLNCYALPYLEP